MKRRNFIATVLAGVAALPIAVEAAKQNEKPVVVSDDGPTHRESATGLRFKEIRLIRSDVASFTSKVDEQELLRIVKNSRKMFR